MLVTANPFRDHAVWLEVTTEILIRSRQHVKQVSTD
jgi:hypothetical protein